MITIAVAKGYLLTETLHLLTKNGYRFSDDVLTTRKLFVDDSSGKLRLLLVRPWDVPAYVEHGAADLGVVGKDILLEQAPNIATIMDLSFGSCSLVIAGPETMNISDLTHNIVVASKFVNSATRYFRDRGIKATIVKLYGAIELAPLTGLSDVICDLSATGRTLKENSLKILDTVFTSTAHLIANPIGLKVHTKDIEALVQTLSHNHSKST